eukprot:jgi/Mesen1/9684/ME000680S09089
MVYSDMAGSFIECFFSVHSVPATWRPASDCALAAEGDRCQVHDDRQGQGQNAARPDTDACGRQDDTRQPDAGPQSQQAWARHPAEAKGGGWRKVVTNAFLPVAGGRECDAEPKDGEIESMPGRGGERQDRRGKEQGGAQQQQQQQICAGPLTRSTAGEGRGPPGRASCPHPAGAGEVQCKRGLGGGCCCSASCAGKGAGTAGVQREWREAVWLRSFKGAEEFCIPSGATGGAASMQQEDEEREEEEDGMGGGVEGPSAGQAADKRENGRQGKGARLMPLGSGRGARIMPADSEVARVAPPPGGGIQHATVCVCLVSRHCWPSVFLPLLDYIECLLSLTPGQLASPAGTERKSSGAAAHASARGAPVTWLPLGTPAGTFLVALGSALLPKPGLPCPVRAIWHRGSGGQVAARSRIEAARHQEDLVPEERPGDDDATCPHRANTIRGPVAGPRQVAAAEPPLPREGRTDSPPPPPPPPPGGLVTGRAMIGAAPVLTSVAVPSDGQSDAREGGGEGGGVGRGGGVQGGGAGGGGRGGAWWEGQVQTMPTSGCRSSSCRGSCCSCGEGREHSKWHSPLAQQPSQSQHSTLRAPAQQSSQQSSQQAPGRPSGGGRTWTGSAESGADLAAVDLPRVTSRTAGGKEFPDLENGGTAGQKGGGAATWHAFSHPREEERKEDEEEVRERAHHKGKEGKDEERGEEEQQEEEEEETAEGAIEQQGARSRRRRQVEASAVGLELVFCAVRPPGSGGCALGDVPLLPLLSRLPHRRVLVELLAALLMERRVVVLGDSWCAVSGAVLAAAALLHPFSWQHPFLPVLPDCHLEYAGAPMPVLIGLRRSQLPTLQPLPAFELQIHKCGVVLDVTSGALWSSHRDAARLPKAERKELLSRLRGAVPAMDAGQSSLAASAVLDFFFSIFGQYRKFVRMPPSAPGSGGASFTTPPSPPAAATTPATAAGGAPAPAPAPASPAPELGAASARGTPGGLWFDHGTFARCAPSRQLRSFVAGQVACSQMYEAFTQRCLAITARDMGGGSTPLVEHDDPFEDKAGHSRPAP